MDFEQELKRIAGSYTNQGYQVVVRPGPSDLPPFARPFKLEIVGRRGGEGVLVAVKKNRDELAADANLPRYAEIIGGQPGWRFDFAILEGEQPGARELRGAQELPDEDVTKALGDAEQLIRTGFTRPALITAWAGFEAAMRRRLRASGEKSDWGKLPRPMLNELYSSGILSTEEFPRLERVYRLRSEISHGFAAPSLEPGDVQFLVETANRLLMESRMVKQSA